MIQKMKKKIRPKTYQSKLMTASEIENRHVIAKEAQIKSDRKVFDAWLKLTFSKMKRLGMIKDNE